MCIQSRLPPYNDHSFGLNSACILYYLNLFTMTTFTKAAVTKAPPFNYLRTVIQNPIQVMALDPYRMPSASVFICFLFY